MHIVIGAIVLLFSGAIALHLGTMIEKINPRTANREDTVSVITLLCIWLGCNIVAIWIIARG